VKRMTDVTNSYLIVTAKIRRAYVEMITFHTLPMFLHVCEVRTKLCVI
jgi:hypothetical protein